MAHRAAILLSVKTIAQNLVMDRWGRVVGVSDRVKVAGRRAETRG